MAYNAYDQIVKVISAIQENYSRKHPITLALVYTYQDSNSDWCNGGRLKMFLGCLLPHPQPLNGSQASGMAYTSPSPPTSIGIITTEHVSSPLYIIFIKHTRRRSPTSALSESGRCPFRQLYGLKVRVPTENQRNIHSVPQKY